MKSVPWVSARLAGLTLAATLAAQTVPPPVTIQLLTPAPNSTVQGQVTLSVGGLDAALDVYSVEFVLNGKVVCGPMTRPFTCDWNSASIWDSTVGLEAIARGVTGSIKYRTPKTYFKVSNGVGSVSLVSPAAGTSLKGVVQWTLRGYHPSGVEAWMFYVDGTLVSQQWGDFGTRTVSLNTANLSNGFHELFAVLYSKLPGNPPLGMFREKFNVYNKGTNRLAAEWRDVYLLRGESVTLHPVYLSPDLVETPVTGALYTSANPGIATVDSAGVVQAVSPGTTSVTIASGGYTGQVKVLVKLANTFPHFGNDGSLLTSYDPAKSIFLRTMFFLNADAMRSSASLAARIRTSDINALTTGFYTNPVDNHAPNLASWKAGYDSWWGGIVGEAASNGMSLLVTGDDIARTPAEMGNSVLSSWGPAAVQYAFTKARDSRRVVSVEMVDEASFVWGDTPKPADNRWMRLTPSIPNNGFSSLMSNINTVAGRPLVSWPIGGSSNATIAANWLGDSSMSDYSSYFWTYMDWRRAYPDGASLPQARWAMERVVTDRIPMLQQNVPQLILTAATGPFYTKKGPGTRYTPGQDLLQEPGELPRVVGAQIMYAAVNGLAGVRTYGFDFDQWKRERATSPVGMGDLQTGADPSTVGTDRWVAMSGAFNLVHQLEPYLLQPAMHALDLGPDIITGARQGPDSRLLMAVNFSDTEQLANIRVNLYQYANAAYFLRYRLTANTLRVEQIAAKAIDRVTLLPGETVAYLFIPGDRQAVVAPPSISILVPTLSVGEALTSSGTLSLTAAATGNTVQKLELVVDGAVVQVSTRTYVTFALDLTPLAVGVSHPIAVRATDVNGKWSESRLTVIPR